MNREQIAYLLKFLTCLRNGKETVVMGAFNTLIEISLELDRMRDSIMKSSPHNDFINEWAATLS